MRKLLIFLLSVSSLVEAGAQTVTGAWYGRADVNSGSGTNNYLVELVLKQKGDEVEGVFAYYFKDSYQSFFVRGTYDKVAREVHIKNLPVLHYKGETRNGIECPMNFLGTLLVSQVNSTLNGYFYSDDKYKYTCPELRVQLHLDVMSATPDSLLANTVAEKKFWKPAEEDAVVVAPSGDDKPVVPPAVTPPVRDRAREKAEKAREKLVASFEKRASIYSKDLEVVGDSVRISFYDNGDIDGDTISVFLNKQPIVVRQGLDVRSLNIYVKLDSLKDINEISMYAENLGKYPPNTALMIVTDGINRYEVYLSSSLTQNAAVRLRRKKTGDKRQ